MYNACRPLKGNQTPIPYLFSMKCMRQFCTVRTAFFKYYKDIAPSLFASTFPQGLPSPNWFKMLRSIAPTQKEQKGQEKVQVMGLWRW